MTPKNVKPLLGDTKSHSKFQPNMICSYGAILALSSDDDAAAAATTNDERAIPICLPAALVSQSPTYDDTQTSPRSLEAHQPTQTENDNGQSNPTQAEGYLLSQCCKASVLNIHNSKSTSISHLLILIYTEAQNG